MHEATLNWYTLKKYIQQLIDEHLVSVESFNSSDMYYLTPKGEKIYNLLKEQKWMWK